MPRSANAQLAVDLFDEIADRRGLTRDTAWKAIAELLLTCEVWTTAWGPFKDIIVFREVNDFKKARPDSLLMQRAERLSTLVANELGFPRRELCKRLGAYWRLPQLRSVQPHNPVGHAFRSTLVRALERFGDPKIRYEEEADPRAEFPGYDFGTRSGKARIDIIARRGNSVVSLISSRWRFRHDRVDVVDEAIAYAPAARRQNPNARFYTWLGEFSPSRLVKVLENCPPSHSNPAINAAIHFNPALIRDGLGENGRLAALKDLAWLANQTFSWT